MSDKPNFAPVPFPRQASVKRETRETSIELTLGLDGTRQVDVRTGLGFFDHMVTALAFHAGWDLLLVIEGDLDVDDHHTIEDCGLALGQALDEALGDRRGIERFGSAYAPLDEALARCVIDISGRSSALVELDLRREMIGQVACENLAHFFQSLAITARLTLHLDVLRGANDHHRAEAAFKATALALRNAVRQSDERCDTAVEIPSTKGIL